MLKTAIRSIEGMAGKMLEKYRINRNREKGIKEEEVKKKEEQEILVKEQVGDIVENMRYRNRDKGVEIRYEWQEGEKEVIIKGDKTDFGRMMINVIKKGEIEVRDIEKGEEVEIKVKDSGKGMSKDMVEKIERGEEVGTTKKGGYGIGMQQIIGTVKGMRGEIKIESKEGEGTEFILTFPKAEKDSTIKN
ncbi:MAG: HAMP domain-containing histidine kinase [Endomicrobium sp.]|jgi:signal transduction histidine kinase|nr:HAMP domain-containing histidine kinase [Endomicrobium sp.]